MSTLIATNRVSLIVGLGATGFSVARYLHESGRSFCVADESPRDVVIQQFQQSFPGSKLLQGPFQYENWTEFDEIILSPGVPRKHPAIQAAIDAGISVVGDVELFLRKAKAPIVAITGANGKTTVTTLVGKMAQAAGLNVRVGGNIGTPALDLLGSAADLYVLELSSFQLESIFSLKAAAATILNISPDHMDRYKDLAEYHAAKQKIYLNARCAVVNRDDALTQPLLNQETQVSRFGLNEPDLKDFGLRQEDGDLYLAFGLRNLLNVKDLKIRGLHNYANSLAALALGRAAGLPESAMLEALKAFEGLPHRCQLVGHYNGVDYINDSKATNIGATEAALKGLASSKPNIVLVAGGDGKGADFSALAPLIQSCVKAVTLIGRDAEKLASVCEPLVPTKRCESLKQAVEEAEAFAEDGDIVLLSPACASLDMFKNYEDRGEKFCQIVRQLCQASE